VNGPHSRIQLEVGDRLAGTEREVMEPDSASLFRPAIDRLRQQKATNCSETLAASRITQSDHIGLLEPG
jgi:hypothetical protein